MSFCSWKKFSSCPSISCGFLPSILSSSPNFTISDNNNTNKNRKTNNFPSVCSITICCWYPVVNTKQRWNRISIRTTQPVKQTDINRTKRCWFVSFAQQSPTRNFPFYIRFKTIHFYSYYSYFFPLLLCKLALFLINNTFLFFWDLAAECESNDPK